MMMHTPYGLYLQAETKKDELEQNVRQEQLLKEAGPPPFTPRPLVMSRDVTPSPARSTSSS